MIHIKKINNIVICSLFSALICIGAFIRIPLPELSITMQVFFVLLAGLLLDAKRAITAVIIYILLGLAGLPVFSTGGGFSYILKPGFGYLVGFAVCAGVMGKICGKNACIKKMLVSCIAGVAVIYLFGISYYTVISRLVMGLELTAEFIITICVLPMLPGDVLSVVLAVVLADRIKKSGIKL